jgi:nitrite reductase/ring-hydroxylating ferredoxin subunit
VQEEPLLFMQVAGTYYAYRNRCGDCGAPLDSGILEGTTLRCVSCGRSYDVCRAGRSLDAAGLFLEAVPLLMEDGAVKVALPAAVGKVGQPQALLSGQREREVSKHVVV